MKKSILFMMILSNLAFAGVESINIKDITVPQKLRVPYHGKEKEFQNGFKTGVGSAITLKSIKENGEIEFYALTDRGPNADIPKYMKDGVSVPGKFFPTQNFTPTIGILKAKPNESAILIDKIEIKDINGKKITGLPLPPGSVGSTGEIALDLNMNELGFDINGLDPEGIAVDKNGNFWICDEYGPFILQIDKTGKILQKFEPGRGLPEVLKYRVPNRGFEGLTIDENGYVYATVQSTLDIEGKTKDKATFTRVIKLNPQTKEVQTFAYPLDNGYQKNSAAKIGDICSLGNNKFLVIEQGKQHGKMQNLIYKVDFSEATDITNLNNLEGEDLKEGVLSGKKELLLNLRDYGWTAEKAEGITLLPNKKTIVVINDNDFGMTIKQNVKNYYYDGSSKKLYKNNQETQENFILKDNEEKSQLWLINLDSEL